MTKASYKYVYGKTTADISVSEGIAPSAYFLPDENYYSLDAFRTGYALWSTNPKGQF